MRIRGCRGYPTTTKARTTTLIRGGFGGMSRRCAMRADVVTRYVNKHLAHLERNATVTAPTLVDLDNAIDLLGTTLQRYLLLTTGQNLASVTPLLMFDWTSVFNQPWRTK
jgi:hypothetical protein